jgi:hypothetical protein
MKRTIAKILVVVFLLINTMPSSTASAIAQKALVIPGFTEITYPSQISMGKSKCKTVNFKYVNDEDLVQENSVFLIQILHKTKKVTHGYGAWFSVLTANPKSFELGPMPRVGVIPIKLCKKSWIVGSGKNREQIAGTPSGNYRIYFAAGFVDSVSGQPLEGKIEIFRTLKVS